MKYDIITIGGAVVDAFVETNILKKKEQLSYPAGEKILMEELDFHTGGGATNTAVAFSKLGLKVGCISKLGKDNNANRILNELKKSNVKFLGSIGKKPTGFSVILIDRNNNRTILQEKGASANLSFKELDLRKLNTKWFYFSSSVGKTLRTQKKLAKWASKRKIKITYNPSSYLTKEGIRKIKRILKYTDVLILNKEEAEDLVGKKDMFAKIHKLGIKIVCITDGKNGSKASDGEKVYSVKPKKIKVKERTGAGDAFASGFIAGLIKKKSIEDALKIGTINAESVITKRGAKNGLLSWREIIKKLR